MKIQYERQTMKTRKQSFRPASVCLALAIVVAAAFSVSSAMAAPILFPFTDGNNSGSGSANLLHLAFDSQDADGSRSTTIEGLLITSVNAVVPRYTDGGTTWNWNGIDYASSTSVPIGIQDTNISGSGTGVGVGINSSLIGGGGGTTGTEGGFFNPGESWTIRFDQPVTFNDFELVSFDGAETIRITVGSDVFDLGLADTVVSGSNLLINSASSSADPLFSFVIPANTDITISNPDVAPLSQSKSASFSSEWRIRAFTVTPVPEPSHALLFGIGSLFLGIAKLRKRK